MDELEKHIKSIRDELDIHEPDQALRNRIAGSLPGKQVRLHRVLWRAAIVVIVAGSAFVIMAEMLHRPAKVNDPQVAAVRETSRYYDEKIRALYEEAGPLLTANPDISTELTVGMNELDSLSAQIIHDLDDNIASNEVIEALIKNYRLRIELLEDMLRLMKEEGNEKGKIEGNEL